MCGVCQREKIHTTNQTREETLSQALWLADTPARNTKTGISPRLPLLSRVCIFLFLTSHLTQKKKAQTSVLGMWSCRSIISAERKNKKKTVAAFLNQ